MAFLKGLLACHKGREVLIPFSPAEVRKLAFQIEPVPAYSPDEFRFEEAMAEQVYGPLSLMESQSPAKWRTK
ncbi:hypothetical protein RJ639_025392, partial [Escallonia herrerae]